MELRKMAYLLMNKSDFKLLLMILFYYYYNKHVYTNTQTYKKVIKLIEFYNYETSLY